MKLSILVCTIPRREEYYENLRENLLNQMSVFDGQIELLTDDHPTDNIGRKRNRLLQEAQGEYVCFIDDDDDVSLQYVNLIMEALRKNPDCCSLRGVITMDGETPQIFEHSITYHAYHTNPDTYEVKYERFPNHLNCIRASIAKQFSFPETNHGEDTYWAHKIHLSGKIQTEVKIDKVLYHYLYRTKKTELL